MNAIFCVLKSGGEYTPEYVEKLYSGIKRNLTTEFHFVCLTDVCSKEFKIQNEFEFLPLYYDYPKWWSKMELFRPDLEKYEKILYIDLDTVIVGDLTDFCRQCFEHPNIIMLRDFYFNPHCASGVMLLPSYKREFVWEAWKHDPKIFMSLYARQGDQGFLRTVEVVKECDYFQDLFPNKILSYKAHKLSEASHNSERMKNCCMIAFHGRPKPTDIYGWIRDKWV